MIRFLIVFTIAPFLSLAQNSNGKRLTGEQYAKQAIEKAIVYTNYTNAFFLCR
jgi:hypothetical protein